MKKILCTLCIAAAFVSCNLDEFPLDKLAPENYFNNEEELKTFTNTFYQQNFPEAGAIYSESADVIIVTTLQSEVSGTRTVVNEGGGWDTGSWQPLTYINNYLYYSHRCSDTKARERYDGVARFFRAYFYFLKVRTYGDVPYYDHVLGSTDADVYKARDDRGYVMDRVLEDFDFAARNLPGTWESGNTRVTKWAALAYASRAALYEGTFRKYHGMADADKYLRQAAATAKEFITDSPFYLYEEGTEPYRELFYSENAKTCEVVLCRRYDKAFGISHSVPYNIKFGRTSLTRRFMNHYLMADGSRFTDKEGWETMPYSEETQGRDPRMAQTVLCPGYKQVEATTVTRNTLSSHTGYEPIKFVGTAANSTTSGAASSDWILMRAAEVYLNYAEAANEAYGPDGQAPGAAMTALEALNTVRSRVGMPAVLDAYTTDRDALRPRIKNERAVELCFEGYHYYCDIRRWKDAPSIHRTRLTGMRVTKLKAGATAQYPTGFRYERFELPSNRQIAWKNDGMYYVQFQTSDLLKMKNYVPNEAW